MTDYERATLLMQSAIVELLGIIARRTLPHHADHDRRHVSDILDKCLDTLSDVVARNPQGE